MYTVHHPSQGNSIVSHALLTDYEIGLWGFELRGENKDVYMTRYEQNRSLRLQIGLTIEARMRFTSEPLEKGYSKQMMKINTPQQSTMEP